MAKKTAALLPAAEARLSEFGDRLRAARLRRRLTAKQVAERAGMAPMTLRSLERGGAGVTMGAYLAVMQVLGVEQDLDLLARADPLGRELQDARLPPPKVGARTAPLPAPRSMPKAPPATPAPARPARAKPATAWRADAGFADSAVLAGLLEAPRTPVKRGRR